jgi:hypothetical protein
MFHAPRAATAAAVLVLLACATSARAGLISYHAMPGSGDPALATVTFDDTKQAGQVQITVAVDTGYRLADINGFFFNIGNESLLSGLTVSGSDVTLLVKNANSVTSAGSGNNINGGIGPFDVGLRIGTPGIGTDDIQTTTFLLSAAGVNLTTDMFTGATNAQDYIFGIRLTSVGTEGHRTGSSKLVDCNPIPPDEPPVVTPEPSTFVGLFAMCSLALVVRRLRGAQVA